jgi:hypothetical protein
VKRGILPKANSDADGAGPSSSFAMVVSVEYGVNDPSSGIGVQPPMASFMACVARASLPVRVNRVASRIAANKSFATTLSPCHTGQSRSLPQRNIKGLVRRLSSAKKHNSIMLRCSDIRPYAPLCY